jgi:hypothetical protein
MRLAAVLFAFLGSLSFLTGPVAAGTASAPLSDAELQRLWAYRARQWEGIRLLDGISRSLPERLWLDRLTVSPDQILIEGKAFNTNAIAIANFIENLDRLPDFAEPTLLGVSEESEKTYRFSLSVQAIRQEKALSEKEQASLLRAFGLRNRFPDILRRLRSLLERPGITMDRFVPGALAGDGHPEHVLPVEIRATAESYQALTLLFDHLSRFSPTVALRRMLAVRKGEERGPGFLAVELTLEIPVLSPAATP